MKIAAWLLSIFVFIAATPAMAQSYSPSYDCSLVTDAVEVFVCNDRALAALDRDLSRSYHAYISTLPSDQATLLKKGEVAWVKDRNNRCRSGGQYVDRSCVEATYKGRIHALNSLASLTFSPGAWEKEGMRWVQLASRSTADEAIAIASLLQQQAPQHGPYIVLLALNGWYAVVSGPFQAYEADSILEDMKASNPVIAAEGPYTTKGHRYVLRMYHNADELPGNVERPMRLNAPASSFSTAAVYTSPSGNRRRCSSDEILNKQAICFVALAGEAACQHLLGEKSEAGVVLTSVATSAICTAASSGLQNGTINADAVLASMVKGGISGVGSAMMHQDNDFLTRAVGAFLKYNVVLYEFSEAIDCARNVERQCWQ
nr:lysozyme inhibitor LprI family protein [uncultured Azospirillum sp.]